MSRALVAEQTVIGAVLLNDGRDAELYRDACNRLDPTDFGGPEHRVLWPVLQRLVADGAPTDPVEVVAQLDGNLQRAGGADYIENLRDAVGSSANLPYHVEQVANLARSRAIAGAASMVATAVENDDAATLDMALAELDRAREQRRADAIAFDDAGALVGLPLPEVLLAAIDGRRRSAVLSVGTVTLLLAHGGAGKSSLTLSLGLHAANASPNEHGVVEHCGFAITPGKWAFVGWEDPPGIVGHRANTIAEHMDRPPTAPDFHILVANDMTAHGPLCDADGPTPAMDAVFDQAHEHRCRVLVVDPVFSAFVGNTNSGEEVRRFMDALAHRAHQRNMAVLLVHHSNKLARKSAAFGGNDNADFAAGSGQFHAAARAVLILRALEDDHWTVSVDKASYGRPNFQLWLANRNDSGSIVFVEGCPPAEPEDNRTREQQKKSRVQTYRDALPDFLKAFKAAPNHASPAADVSAALKEFVGLDTAPRPADLRRWLIDAGLQYKTVDRATVWLGIDASKPTPEPPV